MIKKKVNFVYAECDIERDILIAFNSAISSQKSYNHDYTNQTKLPFGLDTMTR